MAGRDAIPPETDKSMTDERKAGVIRGDRFSGGPARSFLSSLGADERIFAADLAVDRAHVVMLAECEIVPAATARAILAALDAIEADGYEALPEGEDVHEAIETAVVERVGEEGGRMHTARSRNDEVATCIRYRLREDVLDALEATLSLRSVLVEVATEHTETLMPGYTHLQPAQPTTVGHWVLSYESAMSRDTARLFEAFERIDRSPLGAAAFAGTPFPIDRERTADLLGFDGLVENAMDAAAGRDFLLETTQALSTLATTLSGLAEDLIVFANRGFVDLADDYASTSSIMPQKKNPDTLELVRAVAGDAAGGVQGITTTLKGLPRAYNRDLQRATPHAWRTVDAVTEATDVVAGAVGTADWNEERLTAEAGAGFSTATGVADAMAAAGVPFRTAHEVVANVTATVDPNESVAVDDVAVALERDLGQPLETDLDRETIVDAIDPARSVASRNSRGGPAPESTRDALVGVEATIEADRETLESRRAVIEDSIERLQEAIDDL